jgi:hypothetical protein
MVCSTVPTEIISAADTRDMRASSLLLYTCFTVRALFSKKNLPELAQKLKNFYFSAISLLPFSATSFTD